MVKITDNFCRGLLQEVESQYTDLILHNNVGGIPHKR